MRTFFFLVLILASGCFAGRANKTAEQERIYTIKKGDTIDRIAERSGVSAQELIEYNYIKNPKALHIGQIVMIPAVGPIDQQLVQPASLRNSGAKQINISHVKRYRGALAFPVHGSQFTSSFGWRGKRFHEGADFAAPEGTPILAAHDGVVVLTSNSYGNYGRVVVVRGEDFLTVYGHTSRNRVSTGDEVAKGDHIADVGETGRATGPHLHFETRVRDPQGRYSAVDPYLFFVKMAD